MKGYYLVLLAPLLLLGCTDNPAESAKTTDAPKTTDTVQPADTVTTGACDKNEQYDLDFQRFDEVAQQLAHASGCFIKVDNLSELGGIKPNPVKGEMSIRQAVRTAIEGTGLQVISEDENTIKIGKEAS